MNVNDKNNLLLASSQEDVDALNSIFYSKFNYPWYPQEFPYLKDPDFQRKFVCQDIGDWGHARLPRNMKIWVAGCGTNQAIFTALRFPDAEIIGTDLSPKSIESCQAVADQLGLKNLRLENQSLNEPRYEEEFDYIICTGVIHHNADPSVTLRVLSKALKQTGIMELMVYNYYHRIFTTAFQKAIRKLCNSKDIGNLEEEFTLTEQLITDFPVDNLMNAFLRSLKHEDNAMKADSLLQPVEHSYTVESLDALAQSCDLELLNHCISQFDVAANTLSWNIDLPNESYQRLSDVDRWQLGNLLMLERSPNLWFYLQKKEGAFTRKNERQICDEFMNTTFMKAGTESYRYSMIERGIYENNQMARPYPMPSSPIDSTALRVYHATNSSQTIGETIEHLSLDTSFSTLNDLRLKLTTSAFPYLIATRFEEFIL